MNPPQPLPLPKKPPTGWLLAHQTHTPPQCLWQILAWRPDTTHFRRIHGGAPPVAPRQFRWVSIPVG